MVTSGVLQRLTATNHVSEQEPSQTALAHNSAATADRLDTKASEVSGHTDPASEALNADYRTRHKTVAALHYYRLAEDRDC